MISKLQKINLEINHYSNNSLLNINFYEKVNLIKNILNENINKTIKEILNEIEEFKIYYLKNLNNEENSNNMLNDITEENIRSSQDLILSPNSSNIVNKINYEKIFDEKENEIINLKEKNDLIQVSFNELYNNHNLKLKEISDLEDDLKNQKKIFDEYKRKSNKDITPNIEDSTINIKKSIDELDAFELKNTNVFINQNYIKTNIISNSTNKNNEENTQFKIKYMELCEEYKKLKKTFVECTQTIYDAIKIFSPNILEDDNISFHLSPSGKIFKEMDVNVCNKILDSKGSNKSHESRYSSYSLYSDNEFISKSVEIFKKYNEEINQKNKKLESDLQEAESKIYLYKITAEEYKKALDLSMKKFIGNISFEKRDMNQKQIDLTKMDSNLNINSKNSNNKQNNMFDNSDDLKDSILYMRTDDDNVTCNFIDISINNNFENNNQIDDLKNNIIAITSNEIKLNKYDPVESLENNLKCSNDAINNLENIIRKYNDDDKNILFSNNLTENNNITYLEGYKNENKNLNMDQKFIDYNKSNYKNNYDFVSSNIILTGADNEKNKIESFSNFTVEDLIEPDEAFKNNNIEYENIRVNLKNLEKFNNPARFKIVAKKIIKNDFKWYLLADKLTDLHFFSYETMLWIPANMIDEKITLYEVDKSADEEYKYSININQNKSNNYKCIKCLKKSNIGKRSTCEININQFNEKEMRNINPNNDRENTIKSYKTENSSSRNFENFEDVEKEENEQNYNNNLLKEIKFNSIIREKNFEIEKLKNIEKELNKKFTEKNLEVLKYRQLSEKLFKVNSVTINSNNNTNKIVSLNKYELLYNQYTKEQEKIIDISKKYEETKIQLDNANNLIENLKLNNKNTCKSERNATSNKKENKNNDIQNISQKSLFTDKNLSNEIQNFKNLISAKYNSEKNPVNFFNKNKSNKIKMHNTEFSNNNSNPVFPTHIGNYNLNFTLSSNADIESGIRDKSNVTEGGLFV